MNDAPVNDVPVTDVPVWAGRRVLVTGHTGFKGSWLTLWLHRLGARVSGLALDAPTTPSMYELCRVGALVEHDRRGDVRDPATVDAAFRAVDPDVVFHLAAQPLVRAAHTAPVETFATNVMGTVNVLDAVRRRRRPAAVVIVTTDKCYADGSAAGGCREDDRLGGDEPYGASKAAAELVVEAYRHSYFAPGPLADAGVAVASARAGNVIGGGDWSADRLVPDFVRAAVQGRPLRLRSPGAVRPWQHVVVPLSGYLHLAAGLLGPDAAGLARPWNFAPVPGDTLAVEAVVERCVARWPGSSWRCEPQPAAPREAPALRLDAGAADDRLGWRSAWDIERTVDATMRWYRAWAGGSTDLRAECLADIAAYEVDARLPGLARPGVAAAT